MKVLQVNKFYHPVVGGIEEVVRQLSEELPSEGVDTEVLAATKRGRGGSETVNGVPVCRTSSLGVVLSTPIAPTFPLHLRRLSQRADILHYHLPNPLAVVSHAIIRPDTPVVVTYHSDIVRQSKALRVYGPLLDRFLKSVDRIITTSPILLDRSERLQQYREKTTIVPLSIDLDTINANGSISDPKIPNRNVPTILFTGRLNYYKGVSYLLEAMATIESPAELLVVGDGPQREKLELQAESLGITDQVYFLGYVDEETLEMCYRTASVFVLPSVEPSEAFGIVQLEAMAHELPVVNTDLPTGVPWVSVDGETGITVPPRDSSALASALEHLLSDPELRTIYGQAARRRVEDKFTEQEMIADTIDVYRDVTVE